MPQRVQGSSVASTEGQEVGGGSVSAFSTALVLSDRLLAAAPGELGSGRLQQVVRALQGSWIDRRERQCATLSPPQCRAGRAALQMCAMRCPPESAAGTPARRGAPALGSAPRCAAHSATDRRGSSKLAPHLQLLCRQSMLDTQLLVGGADDRPQLWRTPQLASRFQKCQTHGDVRRGAAEKTRIPRHRRGWDARRSQQLHFGRRICYAGRLELPHCCFVLGGGAGGAAAGAGAAVAARAQVCRSPC